MGKSERPWPELRGSWEEQQVGGKRDREKPLLGRGGVKVVPF